VALTLKLVQSHVSTARQIWWHTFSTQWAAYLAIHDLGLHRKWRYASICKTACEGHCFQPPVFSRAILTDKGTALNMCGPRWALQVHAFGA